ncbi:MAG: PilZ domain-containing protein [Acidobacteria bacterium]|nr:PilZ domain-containing protein [Acidobacteriota bacterium]
MTPEALIITSDFELCHMVRLAVERFGITAAIALSPADALQQLARNKFDLVVVDCSNLEHGCAALRKMRLNPTHRSAVSIAIVLDRDHTRYVCDSGANFVVAHATYETEVPCTLRSAYGLVLRERGRYNRFPLAGTVLVRAGGSQRTAQLLNISQGGICISGISEPISGTVQLRLSLEDGRAPLAMSGNVVWQREQRVGVQFTSMPKASRTELDAWLAAQFDAQSKAHRPALPLGPKEGFEPLDLSRTSAPTNPGGIHPIVTAIIRGGPVRARCSGCQATIALGNTIGTALEQERKLREAFVAHVQEKHHTELAEVLAASANASTS